jgi:hypothetical protein
MAEEKKSDHKLNRRDLLGSALTGAVVLAGCTCLGLKDALAFAKKSGKPLFSPEALNALFPAKLNGDYKKLLTEAQSDPQSFVRNHFTLTADQEKGLAALTSDDLSSLKLGIGTALHEDLRIQSACGGSAKLPTGSQMVAQGSSFQMYKTPNQEVVIQTGTTSRKRVTLGVGSASEKTGGVEGANSAGGVIFQGTLTLNMMPRTSSD